jgi:hypothetical protein
MFADISRREENPVKHRFLFLLLTSSFLFTATLRSFAADYSGTWVANIEKSQLGSPPPKSEVMKVEKTGPNAYLVTIDMVRADGQNRHQQFTRTYDGKEHASPGAPKEATETCTQVDPLTRHIVGKNEGKVIYEIDAKMAPDGKTMTTRQTFFTPDGQTKEVLVFAFERR